MIAFNPIPLGEYHNGGRYVFRSSDGRIYKPRTLYWEWLFLNASSPFRKMLSTLEMDVNPQWLTLLPDLQIFPEDAQFSAGFVEYVAVSPITEKAIENTCFWESLGAITGLLTLLGVSDLHHENMLFGRYLGRIICAPIDIECLLNDHTLISQTHLLPSIKIDADRCGFSQVKKTFGDNISIDDLAQLVHGYTSILAFATHIRQAFFSLMQQTQPIRVILRKTADYVEHLHASNQSQVFMSSEIQQLQRNDVPYFFRFSASETLYAWNIDTKTPEKLAYTDEQIMTVQKQFLFHENINNNPALLLKAGSLQLANYFSRAKQIGTSQYKNIELRLTEDHIYVTKNNQGWECGRK